MKMKYKQEKKISNTFMNRSNYKDQFWGQILLVIILYGSKSNNGM